MCACFWYIHLGLQLLKSFIKSRSRTKQPSECTISNKQESAVFTLGTRLSRFSRHFWQSVGTRIECFVHDFKAKFFVTQKLKDGDIKESTTIFSGCSARVDLAFIIDGSGSIEAYGRGNFRRCLNFVRAIVSKFSINSGQTRIGIVLYSSRPRLIFDFRRYRRKNQLLSAISRIRYPRGGTKTGYAMRYCYSRVFRYARRGVRRVNLFGFSRKRISLFCCIKAIANKLIITIGL